VIDGGPSGVIGVSSVSFTFHGSDTNDTFQCSLDGAPWASCSSPQQYTGLAEGPHTFEVRAVNAAGEADPTPASASFTVEATPPQASITIAPSGRVPIGEVSISFTSTEAGSTFQCSLDGAAYSPCSSPDVVKDPAAGPHTFTVQATNQAGVKETATPPLASWSSVEPQHDLCGTISRNTTIGPEYAARYIITCTVTVAAGTTLTLDPGAVVKASGAGIDVDPGGVLNASGTSASPVTFTSLNDNSIGGSTGSGSPAGGEYPYAIHLNTVDAAGGSPGSGPTVNVDHTVFRYASYAISDGLSYCCTDEFDGHGSLKVTNSDVESGVLLEGEVDSPILENDTFTWAVTIGSSHDDGNVAPIVKNDTFDITAASKALYAGEVDVHISNADLSGVPLTGPYANKFVGSVTGDRLMLDSDSIPSDATWEISPASGAEVVIVAVGDGESGDLRVGGTLTVDAGSVIKASGAGIDVDPGGVLDVSGTAGSPVTFTSLQDDSVGGDTNGDGDSTQPSPGDWSGISFADAQTVELNYVDIRYAANAVKLELLNAASISHSDFVYDQAAISVGGTTNNDPALAALPCVPPYLSFVDASSDWFGKNGLPAPDIELASVIGAIIPEEYSSLFSAGLSLAGSTSSSFGGDNTIPWSIYSCPVLAIPPMPVTPVMLGNTPDAPWFPDPEA
jgi:hypothetical protein